MSGAALWKSIVGDENASPRTEFIVLLDELGQFPSLLRTSNYVLLGKCSAIRSGKYKLIVGRPGRDDWFPTDPGKCFQSLVHEGAIFDVPNDHKDCIRGDFNYEHALAKDKGHFGNSTNKKTHKQAWRFFLIALFIRDSNL